MTKRRQSVKISEIVITPIVQDAKGMTGFISFTFNNQLRISDVAIFTRPQGNSYRFSYPIKTLKNGKTIQSVYPINKEVESAISEQLLIEYNAFLKKVNND
jgi:DNA-binding cell septation regulator SpoVG